MLSSYRVSNMLTRSLFFFESRLEVCNPMQTFCFELKKSIVEITPEINKNIFLTKFSTKVCIRPFEEYIFLLAPHCLFIVYYKLKAYRHYRVKAATILKSLTMPSSQGFCLRHFQLQLLVLTSYITPKIEPQVVCIFFKFSLHQFLHQYLNRGPLCGRFKF